MTEFTINGKKLQVINCDNPAELKLLERELTLQVLNYKNIKARKIKESKGSSFWRNWDGFINFFTAGGCDVGLWKEVLEIGENNDLDWKINNMEELIDQEITLQDVEDFVDKNFTQRNPKFTKRPYQIESIYHLIRNRYAQAEIGTSGGKSLIIYCLYKMLQERGKINKMLIIVPTVDLVIQMFNDFMNYHDFRNSGLQVAQIYSGVDSYTHETDVLISTFQSLGGKDKSFFKEFDCVMVDECHRASAVTIKKILKQYCGHVKYRFGVSGTIRTMENEGSADLYNYFAYIGPIVYNVSASELIEGGYSTKVKVYPTTIKYAPLEDRKKMAIAYLAGGPEKGAELYAAEWDYIAQSKIRMDFIIKLALLEKKNTLILFSDVKGEYGKRIYHELRDGTNDRVCFYVDGTTPKKIRSTYIKEMEKGDDKIMIATFKTFATGISINNLHCIIFAESYKSEVLTKQALGRGMRLHSDKDFVRVVDIIDDLSVNYTVQGEVKTYQNFALRHGKKRIQIYENEGHELLFREKTLS